MTGINLLPWREELRKIRNNVFYVWIGVSVGSALIIVFVCKLFLETMIEKENANIEIIKTEQEGITSKIKEIQGLQKNKAELLHRREIIQSLQANRSQVVRLLDVIPRVIPEGVVLNSMERKGSEVTILGTAKTPGSISTLMKNLEDQRWKNMFTNVRINEVALEKDEAGVGFILEFTLGAAR